MLQGNHTYQINIELQNALYITPPFRDFMQFNYNNKHNKKIQMVYQKQTPKMTEIHICFSEFKKKKEKSQ